MKYGMGLGALLEGWLQDVPDIAVRGITQDPCRVRAGSILVLPREDDVYRTPDLEEAVARGCAAVLHDSSVALSGLAAPTIPVDMLGSRLGQMASRFWAAPSDLMTVVAVAGHSERAAVTHYLAQVWQRSCGKGGMFGSLGSGPMNSLQPLDLAAADVFRLNEALAHCLDTGIEHVAVEISPCSLQQERCQTLQIDLALISGVERGAGPNSQVRRLFTEYAPTFAVVNFDDPVSRGWIDEFGDSVELLSFGLDPAAELSARIVTMDDEGMAVHLSGPWGEKDILTDLRGEDEARNLLALAGSLVLLGMDWNEVCRQLEYVRPATSEGPRSDTGIAAGRALERAA